MLQARMEKMLGGDTFIERIGPTVLLSYIPEQTDPIVPMHPGLAGTGSGVRYLL